MHKTRLSYFTLEENFEKILNGRKAISIEVKKILKEIGREFIELYNGVNSNWNQRKGLLYIDGELEILFEQLETERKSSQVAIVRNFLNQIDREIEKEEESGREISVQEELAGARKKKGSIKNIANQLGEGLNPNTIQLLKRFLRQIHSRQRYFLLEQDIPISVIDRMDNVIQGFIEKLEQNFNMQIGKAYEDDNDQLVKELLEAFELYLKSKENYVKYRGKQDYKESLRVTPTISSDKNGSTYEGAPCIRDEDEENVQEN